MERKIDLIEGLEDLGAASIETMGPPGNQYEFGILGRTVGLESE